MAREPGLTIDDFRGLRAGYASEKQFGSESAKRFGDVRIAGVLAAAAPGGDFGRSQAAGKRRYQPQKGKSRPRFLRGNHQVDRARRDDKAYNRMDLKRVRGQTRAVRVQFGKPESRSMDEIVSQVQRARRRLVLQQFLQVTPWVMFGALLVAVIGLAIPKIWVIPGLDSAAAWQRWVASWVVGSTLCGMLVAMI